MDNFQLLIWAGIALTVYKLVSLRLTKMFQPLRLEVAEKVEDLLNDEKIADDVRRDLDILANSMFNNFAAWLLVLTIPVGVLFSIFRPNHINIKDKRPKVETEIRFIYRQGLLCMIATSPLCLAIFLLELLFLQFLFFPVGRGTRRAAHMVFNQIGNDTNSSLPY